MTATQRNRQRSSTAKWGTPRSRLRYRSGYDEGYRAGVQQGMQSYGSVFAGTSIVIPAFNQVAMTKRCIESIVQHTHTPYEIIIVDNASTDHTQSYLKSLCGTVRYRTLDTNRGFAGAINVGMMMAKGQTIALLNNDTVVTAGWLDNLLTCLRSDSEIGMVGPVTNSISGPQQINDVPYRSMEEMQRYARDNNVSNPSRWHQTELLIGFCLLFDRSVFERIGYFDEGFEIGNFEDNDYCLRVRLLGKKLVYAEDAFIHHFGSVSMKKLGSELTPVNNRNEQFYQNKWPDALRTLHESVGSTLWKGGMTATSLYPEHMIVKGAGPEQYWIEQGKRRPIAGQTTAQATRVSLIDLRRWPIGDSITAHEAEHRWRSLVPEALHWGVSVVARGGEHYHLEGHVLRRIVGTHALQSWGLHMKPTGDLPPEKLAQCTEGLPIVSPPMLKHQL